MTWYIDKVSKHLSKGSEEQCNDVKLQIWYVLTSKRLIKMFCLTKAHHDVSKTFLQVYSKIVASISQNRNVFKRYNLLQNNIWSRTADLLADLMFVPVCAKTPIHSNLKLTFGFTIISSIAATTLKLVTDLNLCNL